MSINDIRAQKLELEDCMQAVNKNYPLLKQKNVEKEINEISIKLNNANWLPQVVLNSQATYQSEVTSISIPGINTIPLSKDQYKAYLEVTQQLYDGGINKVKNDLQNLSSKINDGKVDVEIRNIMLQTQKFFFNALTAQENIIILTTSQNEIKERIKVQEAAVKYGTAKQSQVDVLQVELLQIDQQIIETNAGRKTSLATIALFTGLSISENTICNTPGNSISIGNDFENRPDFKNFQFQKETLDKNYNLITAKWLPKASLFGNGGYGKPGLNQLKNDFSTYYTVGARVNWDLSSFYNTKPNKKLNDVNKEAIDIQKNTLETNLKSQKVNLDQTVNKLDELINKDHEIVVLRTKISKVSAAELDNGISTATNYLIEKNEETAAKQALKIHEIQKIATQYEIKNLTGN